MKHTGIWGSRVKDREERVMYSFCNLKTKIISGGKNKNPNCQTVY